MDPIQFWTEKGLNLTRKVFNRSIFSWAGLQVL